MRRMFTGIVQTTGELRSVRVRPDDAVLDVAPATPYENVVPGESIAVNGVCLTVVGGDGRGFQAEASRETLSRTTLGRLRAGALVNLERALQLSDRLGGHLVQGHVDQVVHLRAVTRAGEHYELAFEKPEAAAPFLVEKGSVALDGVSLTVARELADVFTVAMLRFTWESTAFQRVRVGDAVNAEWDLIGKYVAKQLGARRGGVDEAFLKRHGFA
jgi:riboflavin synthase